MPRRHWIVGITTIGSLLISNSHAHTGQVLCVTSQTIFASIEHNPAEALRTLAQKSARENPEGAGILGLTAKTAAGFLLQAAMIDGMSRANGDLDLNRLESAARAASGHWLQRSELNALANVLQNLTRQRGYQGSANAVVEVTPIIASLRIAARGSGQIDAWTLHSAIGFVLHYNAAYARRPARGFLGILRPQVGASDEVDLTLETLAGTPPDGIIDQMGVADGVLLEPHPFANHDRDHWNAWTDHLLTRWAIDESLYFRPLLSRADFVRMLQVRMHVHIRAQAVRTHVLNPLEGSSLARGKMLFLKAFRDLPMTLLEPIPRVDRELVFWRARQTSLADQSTRLVFHQYRQVLQRLESTTLPALQLDARRALESARDHYALIIGDAFGHAEPEAALFAELRPIAKRMFDVAYWVERALAGEVTGEFPQTER